MRYSWYDLLWIFLVCSVGGWCGELVISAVRRHKFVNRGFVSGPICPIYGVAGVAFAIFLPELRNNLFFLFLGGTIVASMIEYFTGLMMERFLHRKWWDYSSHRFHLDGYICLQTSLVWGVLAVLSIWFLFPAIFWLVRKIPAWLHVTTAWISAVLLVIDFIGSILAVLGMKKSGRIYQITKELQKTSRILENALTHHIQTRMVKAYPSIDKTTEESNVFASGYSFYKLVSLFLIGSVLGDIVETVFMYVTTHKWVSRSSVVYGPFSLVWGLGCVLLTMVLYQYKEKGDRYLFVTGTLLGGAYEYICSVFTELVFGTVFWDYSKHAFNLAGRINLLYCFFWGIAAVIWMKGVYPLLSKMIEKIPKRAGKIICNLLIVFMIYNVLISSAALMRYTARYQEKPASNRLEEYLDEAFPDEKMEKIYPYARFRV